MREPSYLVVKRSVGSLLDGRLFFLVTDLDHDTGVDVLTHQLPGLGDVDGDLQEQNNKQDATAQMNQNLYQDLVTIRIYRFTLSPLLTRRITTFLKA